jgi:hypothetical protein
VPWRRKKQWSYTEFAEQLSSGDDGLDMDIGWKAQLYRGGEDQMDTRWLWVIVAPGTTQSPSLPRAVRRAIQSRGHTVMEGVCHLDDPPRVLVVDETGIRPQ